MLNNVLILSPHQDDEALGCGGLITSEKAFQVHVRYYNNVHTSVSYSIYTREAQEVAELGKFEVSVSPLTGVNHLVMYSISEFITDIENTINEIKPEYLFIPMCSRNQDHQIIFDAARVAIRPHDKIHFVKNVYIYEQPEYTDQIFIPNTYLEIDIDKKIELFGCYKTQHRSYRTDEHLRYLAGLRGLQCGVPFAEAYQSIRTMI